MCLVELLTPKQKLLFNCLKMLYCLYLLSTYLIDQGVFIGQHLLLMIMCHIQLISLEDVDDVCDVCTHCKSLGPGVLYLYY